MYPRACIQRDIHIQKDIYPRISSYHRVIFIDNGVVVQDTNASSCSLIPNRLDNTPQKRLLSREPLNRIKSLPTTIAYVQESQVRPPL